MPFPDWKAGMKITPARLAQMQTVVIQPVSSQTVNNSNVLVNDNELTYPLEANAQYIVEIHAVFDSFSDNADVKTDWLAPSEATGLRLCIGASNSSGGSTDSSDTRAQFTASSLTSPPVSVYQMYDTRGFIQEYACVTNGATAGDLVFRWAQNVSTAADTTRTTASYMKVQRFA